MLLSRSLEFGLIIWQCIEQPTRWAIHHLEPLPKYVSGRVALLGDAVRSDTSIPSLSH